MMSLKISSALTIGKGIDESQRIIWSLSMPACVSKNQELSRVIKKTEEQNKDMPKPRQSCDLIDTTAVVQFLKARNLSEYDGILHNIACGVHAYESVNVDSSRALGVKILSVDGLQ